VSAEVAGLGNRIKSWVSAMRLGNDVRVYWPVNHYMPAKFNDLFAGDCEIDTIAEGAETYAAWRLHLLPEDLEHIPAGFSVAGAGSNPLVRGIGKAWWKLTGSRSDRYDYMLFPKSYSPDHTRADARHIDLEYGRIPDYFKRVYVPLFERITPRPELQARADEWVSENINDNVVGVQVRTWRDEPRRYRKYHLPARKRLFSLMQACDPSARFVVVSDADEILQELADKFGKQRILSFPRRTSRNGSWQHVDGVVEDLIDMLILSRTQTMFASYLSTFSETAWWLGGAKGSVRVF
jgi:hypothetical protein